MEVLSKYDPPRRVLLTRRRHLVARTAVGAQVGLLLFGMALTAIAQDDPTIAQLRGEGIEQRLNNQAPLDLKFRDENGATVTLGSYFNKGPVIISLIYYTCPMMCPLVEHGLVNSLRDVKANMGKQYQVVTVSIDPTDTPESAKAQKATYVGLYGRPGAGQGWHFLVGDLPAIRQLAQAVGFRSRYMMHMHDFDHAAGIVVLTPSGKVSRYFLGTDYPSAEVRAALVDASHGKIGKPAQTIPTVQKGN
jgi:protein SCO1